MIYTCGPQLYRDQEYIRNVNYQVAILAKKNHIMIFQSLGIPTQTFETPGLIHIKIHVAFVIPE